MSKSCDVGITAYVPMCREFAIPLQIFLPMWYNGRWADRNNIKKVAQFWVLYRKPKMTYHPPLEGDRFSTTFVKEILLCLKFPDVDK